MLMKLLPPSQYQPQAARVFASVARDLSMLLPEAQVEHAGASAIPEAVSKGDLDICLLVEPRAHPAAVDALLAAGYAIKPGTLRTPALCMLVSPRAEWDLAVQVVAKGSEFESCFLGFRDALRGNADLVARYNQLQQQFADAGEDHYRAEKSRFISAVLAAT